MMNSNHSKKKFSADFLLQLVAIMFMLPLLFGELLGGSSLWLFYFGGITFLHKNKKFFKSFRLWGFTLGEHNFIMAKFIIPLIALALVTTVWGSGSFTIWFCSILSTCYFLYLTYPSGRTLKKLHAAFIDQVPPYGQIPYFILGLPSDNKPKVSLLFIFFLNSRIFREGIRYFSIGEKVRNLKELEKMDITSSLSFLSDPRIRTFSDILEKMDKKKGEFNIWYRASQVIKSFPLLIGALLDHKLSSQVGYVFLTKSQLMDKGLEFCTFCESYAAGVITIPGKSPTLKEQYKNLKIALDLDIDEFEKLAEKQGYTKMPLEQYDPRLWNRLGAFEFSWAHSIPGPWYILSRTTTDFPETLSGFVPISTFGMRTWRSSARNVNDLLSQQAIPTAYSSCSLDNNKKKLPKLIAQNGLAPIADAYMRFRHSTSAVERFLNLFDCFEAVIKYSYFFLISVSGKINEFSVSIPDDLNRPSLGHWVTLLQRELKQLDSNPVSTINIDFLKTYWNCHLSDAPKSFIEAVNGVGLAEQIEIPRTHLNWLSWLVALRNKTKGHGGTTESIALPLWHDFHLSFLDMVEGLKEIVIDSKLLITQDSTESVIKMDGWIRGPFRSALSLNDIHSKQFKFKWAKLNFQNAIFELAPFVYFENNQCLTWNGSPKQSIAEYTDYSTGRITRESLIEQGFLRKK